jgi:hypothetical protein
MGLAPAPEPPEKRSMITAAMFGLRFGPGRLLPR